jgi:hypothetical protein
VNIAKKIFFKSRDTIRLIQTKYKQKKFGYPITLMPEKAPIRGRALYSYLIDPFYFSKNDSRFNGHTNRWESLAIAHALKNIGYIVDVIDFRDNKFVPTQKYDLIFDMYQNLPTLSKFSQNSRKILHLTRSYDPYSNEAELKRIENLKIRRPGAKYSPIRQIKDLNKSLRSIEIADLCILMGNEETLKTYPKKFHKKISLINTTGSPICKKTEKNYVPSKKEFLWFFGCGAVHKGLDLLIEIFAKHPELTLNIVGSIDVGEEDFFKIYEKEFRECKNIKYHGYLQPSSKKFIKILEKTFCFIAPSASESMSTACVTCMQAGLYPILSKNCGVTLPKNSGTYLETCSLEEIEKKIIHAYNMKKDILENEIEICQQYALKEFSREAFVETLKELFIKLF